MSKVSSEIRSEDYKISEDRRHGGVFSGYTVMTKSMIGSGILSIAFACSKCGLLLGIFLLFLAALLTWLSLHVLCQLSLEVSSTEVSFHSIASHIMPKVKRFLDLALIVDCGGAAIAFIQTMGQLLAKSFEQTVGFGTLSERVLIIIIQTVIVVMLFPMCLMKEITDTKILNIVGLLGLVYVAILAMVYTDLSDVSATLLYPEDAMSGVSGFLIMIFAFSCQQNVLSVSTEMKNPTMRKLDAVTGSAICTGFLMYLPVMILPFLTFGRSKSDAGTFFELLPPTVATQIGYVCAAVSVSISFVLVVHPIRRSIMTLLYGDELPTGKKELKVRTVIVSAIVLVCLAVAIAAGSSLGPTLEFTALLGANTCGFVMPCLLYLKHFGFQPRSFMSLAVLAMLLFCIALYPIGITAAVLGIVNS